jgi:hypothetical protein
MSFWFPSTLNSPLQITEEMEMANISSSSSSDSSGSESSSSELSASENEKKGGE